MFYTEYTAYAKALRQEEAKEMKDHCEESSKMRWSKKAGIRLCRKICN